MDRDCNCRRLTECEPRSDYAPGVRWVLAVSGAAALGKTTLCKSVVSLALQRQLAAEVVALDGFLIERDTRIAMDISGYDHRATNFTDLHACLHQLIQRGHETWFPTYSHENKGKRGAPTLHQPRRLLILDGIASLQHDVRRVFPNITLFLSSDAPTRSRLRRAVDERRGHIYKLPADDPREETAYVEFIAPQETSADFVVRVMNHGVYDWSG
jgi:uridine kinase